MAFSLNRRLADIITSTGVIEATIDPAYGIQPNITRLGTLDILNIDNLRLDGNTISSMDTNGHITLTPNGTGEITLGKAANVSVQLDFTDQGSNPSAAAGTNKVYSKTPSGGGTGLYFVNNTTSGEMISKSKAIAFSLVF